MSCECGKCGRKYKVDLIIPDELWEKIKPQYKPKDAGLLCGSCIMRKIEDIGEYDSFFLRPL